MKTITAIIKVEVEVGDFATDEMIQERLHEAVLDQVTDSDIDIADVEYGERDEPFDMSGSTPGVER